MATKKQNCKTVGRPPVAARIYMLVYLRWCAFLRSARRKNPRRLKSAIAADFMESERQWFRDHGISTGNYPTFANWLWLGKLERGRVVQRRRREWRVVGDLTGRRSISANPHLRLAAEQALLASYQSTLN